MHHPLNYLVAAVKGAIVMGGLGAWPWLLDRVVTTRRLPVEYEPRQQVPWSGVDLAWLGFAWLALEAISAGLLFGDRSSQPGGVTPALLVAVGVIRLVWLAIAIVYLNRVAGAYFDDMGFDTRKLGYDLRLAGVTFLVATLPVYAIYFVLTQVFGYESGQPILELVIKYPSGGVLLIVTIVAIVIAPVVEEFLCRVLIQGWLEKRQLAARARLGGDPNQPAGWGPIVVASAIFALLHLGHGPDVVALFVLSLFLGFVYQRTHRIIPSVAVHVCVNALAMLELWRAFFVGSS